MFQRNLNTSLLDKLFVEKTMQPLQFLLKPPQYLLSTDTKTVELVGSPNISIPNKDNFSFLRGGKLDNIVFPMKHANLFDTYHPVREDHDKDSTTGDKNKNTVRSTAAKTTKTITSPPDESIL